MVADHKHKDIEKEIALTNELDIKEKKALSPLRREMFSFSSKLVQQDFIEPYIKGKVKPLSPLIIAYLVDLYSNRNENMFANIVVNDRFIDQLCNDLIKELEFQDNTNQEIDDLSFHLDAMYKNKSYTKMRNLFYKKDKSQNEQENLYRIKLNHLTSISNVYEVNFFKNYFIKNEDGTFDYKEFDIHFKTDKFEVDVELKNKLTVFLDDIVSFYVKCFYKMYHYNFGKLNSDVDTTGIDFNTNTINLFPNNTKNIFVFACRNVDKFEKYFKKGYINTLVYNALFEKQLLKPALKFNENSNLIAELSKHITFFDLEKSIFYNHTLEETELANMDLIVDDKHYLFTDYFDLMDSIEEKELINVCSEQFFNFVHLFNDKVINLAVDLKLITLEESQKYLIPLAITNCNIIK